MAEIKMSESVLMVLRVMQRQGSCRALVGMREEAQSAEEA